MVADFFDRLLSKKIVVLGAGQLGELLLDLWPGDIALPSLFLDENRTGHINGIEIQKSKDHDFSKSNIYILSYFKEDPRKINELFKVVLEQEIITAYDILTFFKSDMFSNGWIGNSRDLDLVLDNAKFFANERSKEVLYSVAQWRYARVLEEKMILGLESSKYDLEKYGVSPTIYDFICDGGSYDLSFLLKQSNDGLASQTLVAVEPDTQRINEINRLLTKTEYSSLFKSNLQIDNRAFWSSTGSAKFYNNGLLSARVARFPDYSCVDIKTITLSDLMRDFQVLPKHKSLVKLHIEGAEWPVINSSLEYLLGFDHLDLFINLSHDEESLINIPQLLGFSNKYDLYLESHALFGEGVTLFAKTRQ
jgi:FkbM family methyltransferase